MQFKLKNDVVTKEWSDEELTMHWMKKCFASGDAFWKWVSCNIGQKQFPNLLKIRWIPILGKYQAISFNLFS